MLTEAIEKGLMTDMGGGLEYPLDRSGLPDFKNNDNPLLREFEEEQARSWEVVDEAEPKNLNELRSVHNLGLRFVRREAHSVVPETLWYSPDYWDPVSDGDDLALQAMSEHHSDDNLGYTSFDDSTPEDRKMSKKRSAGKRSRQGQQKKVLGKADKKSKKSKNGSPKTASMIEGIDKDWIEEAQERLQKQKNRRLPFVVLGEDASVEDRKLMSEAYDILDAVAPKANVPIGKLVILLWLDQLEHNFLLRDFVKRMLNMGLSEFLDQMCLQEPFAEYPEYETIIRRIHNWTLLTPEMKSSFLGTVEIQ
ncbi:unnamed protein product [Caenorhabditis nigoni]